MVYCHSPPVQENEATLNEAVFREPLSVSSGKCKAFFVKFLPTLFDWTKQSKQNKWLMGCRPLDFPRTYAPLRYKVLA